MNRLSLQPTTYHLQPPSYDKSHDWIHDFLFRWRTIGNSYDDNILPQETHNTVKMKIKLMPLFGGLIALSVASAPFILKAQAQVPDQPAPTQTTRQHHGMWDKLNLSDPQKTQMKQIHDDIRNQIKAVLTPEQQAQLQAAKQNHQANQANQANQAGQPHRGRHSAMAALNLTDAQKAKIKAIKEDGKRRFEALLTAPQKQQLEQMRQQWQQKRQQRQQQQPNNQ